MDWPIGYVGHQFVPQKQTDCLSKQAIEDIFAEVLWKPTSAMDATSRPKAPEEHRRDAL